MSVSHLLTLPVIPCHACHSCALVKHLEIPAVLITLNLKTVLLRWISEWHSYFTLKQHVLVMTLLFPDCADTIIFGRIARYIGKAYRRIHILQISFLTIWFSFKKILHSMWSTENGLPREHCGLLQLSTFPSYCVCWPPISLILSALQPVQAKERTPSQSLALFLSAGTCRHQPVLIRSKSHWVCKHKQAVRY